MKINLKDIKAKIISPSLSGRVLKIYKELLRENQKESRRLEQLIILQKESIKNEHD